MDEPTLRVLIDSAPTAAFAIVIVFLFVTGRLHSSSEMNRAINDLDTERAAHEQTRAALAIASARADAGIRAAELVAGAVEGAARHVPQTATPPAPTIP